MHREKLYITSKEGGTGAEQSRRLQIKNKKKKKNTFRKFNPQYRSRLVLRVGSEERVDDKEG